ncbi:hypothetical protein AB0425_00150 [Actinosynnema sp. NPDC051121]
MITVVSCLRARDGSFTPVARCRTAPPDLDYVDGAIDLVINGVAVVDQSMWDLVDQLWAYLVTMLHELREHGRAETCFPDQPLKLRFERIGGSRVLVVSEPSSGPRKSVVDEDELVTVLAAAAIEFFTAMHALAGSGVDYSHELERAAALR